MSEFLEQRACIKFCFKLGKKCTETIDMMRQVFGAECLSRKQIYRWFKRFKNGRESIEQDRIPGRPQSSTNEQTIKRVNEMITENRHVTVRQISEELGISIKSVRRIINHKLEMSCSADGYIPKLTQKGEIPERKRDRIQLTDEFTNIEPVIESVKGIIDAFTERNEYPSVYEVHTELKHHKDIPKMSQTMLYKIMQKIASTENSSNIDNYEVSEDSEGSEFNLNNIKRANHIEHIELNPDITMDYYEESTPAIKEEPDDKLNG